MSKYKYEKVIWYEVFLHVSFGRMAPDGAWGIHTYDGEDLIKSTWYKSEKERDFAYDLHSGVAARIERSDFNE